MTMPNWMTADAIAQRYLVGEAKLLDYATRGNLPIRRSAQGERAPTLFDESVCARFFRPRIAGIVTYREPKGPHMGILGVTNIGAEPHAPRSERRRVVRARFETREEREQGRALRRAG
jgi:hypothetical protein